MTYRQLENLYNRCYSKYCSAKNKQHQYKLKRNTISIVANIFVYVAFTFGYYFALGWGAYKLSLGMISVGTLTAMLQLVSQVQTPFKSLSNVIPHYYQAIASAERIIELETLKDDEKSYDNVYLESFYEDIKSIVLYCERKNPENIIELYFAENWGD